MTKSLSHHGGLTLNLFGQIFVNLFDMFFQRPHPLIEFATELALQEYFQTSSSMSKHASSVLGLMLAYFTLIVMLIDFLIFALASFSDDDQLT